MTEEECLKEFEEEWEKQRRYFNFINADPKDIALWYWLESRRRFIKSLGHKPPSDEQAPKYPTIDFEEGG